MLLCLFVFCLFGLLRILLGTSGSRRMCNKWLWQWQWQQWQRQQQQHPSMVSSRVRDGLWRSPPRIAFFQGSVYCTLLIVVHLLPPATSPGLRRPAHEKEACENNTDPELWIYIPQSPDNPKITLIPNLGISSSTLPAIQIAKHMPYCNIKNITFYINYIFSHGCFFASALHLDFPPIPNFLFCPSWIPVPLFLGTTATSSVTLPTYLGM